MLPEIKDKVISVAELLAADILNKKDKISELDVKEVLKLFRDLVAAIKENKPTVQLNAIHFDKKKSEQVGLVLNARKKRIELSQNV